MDVNAELANLLSKSGGELRKIGDKWIACSKSKACVGDTPSAAVEAFLAARVPRQREVIDRLTVIDTVVREPATPVDDARIKALEDSLSQTDAALRFLLEPVAVESVQYAAFPDPMPAELEKILRNSQHNFPVNLTDRLSDWDPDEASLTTADLSEDLAQLVTGEETLAQAVERMTPGLDELLDMAQALSNASLEKAVATIEPERANDWMERLFSERGRLRLARGTVDENLSRENLINKTVGVFGRVGAKR